VYVPFFLGGGNSNIVHFHLEPWGIDRNWRAYFSNGLVQPPTSFGWCWAWCHIFMTPPRLRYLEARRTENPGLGGECRLVVWLDFSCGDARSGVFFLYFCIIYVYIINYIMYFMIFYVCSILYQYWLQFCLQQALNLLYGGIRPIKERSWDTNEFKLVTKWISE